MADKAPIKPPKISVPIVNRSAMEAVRQIVRQLAGYNRNIERVIHDMRISLNASLGKNPALTNALKGWGDAIQGTVKNQAAKNALQEHGILPHKSTPWEIFDSAYPSKFPDAVMSYYSTDWDKARAVFLADLDTYKIGQEAKDAFIEGIECHAARFYRPTIMSVLPAAETEFRNAFQIAPGKPAASLEELRKAVGEAPFGMLLGHVAPLELYKMLDRHLYMKVQTEEDVTRFAADPIPNRHAAIHGLIQYKSELNSLNALILTDYVFFLINQIVDHLEPVD